MAAAAVAVAVTEFWVDVAEVSTAGRTAGAGAAGAADAVGEFETTTVGPLKESVPAGAADAEVAFDGAADGAVECGAGCELVGSCEELEFGACAAVAGCEAERVGCGAAEAAEAAEAVAAVAAVAAAMVELPDAGDFTVTGIAGEAQLLGTWEPSPENAADDPAARPGAAGEPGKLVTVGTANSAGASRCAGEDGVNCNGSAVALPAGTLSTAAA